MYIVYLRRVQKLYDASGFGHDNELYSDKVLDIKKFRFGIENKITEKSKSTPSGTVEADDEYKEILKLTKELELNEIRMKAKVEEEEEMARLVEDFAALEVNN